MGTNAERKNVGGIIGGLIMQEILIREELLDEVKAGRKTTTCRNGKRDYAMGETRLKSNSTENFAMINLLKMEFRTVGTLDDEIAKTDGFKTKSDFISVMEDIYGKLDDDSVITVVYFELLK